VSVAPWSACGGSARVLIVPGLYDSGPDHWQTRLQQHHHRRALRVRQHDWSVPDLEAWADRILETLRGEPRSPCVAVAHSFGCLALVRALLRGATGIDAAVLVAPADPLKFGVGELLPCQPLPISSTLVASRTDPWLPFGSAVNWSRAWGSSLIDLGDAGHVNQASGHGPWPQGKLIVEREIQRVNRRRRLAGVHGRESLIAA